MTSLLINRSVSANAVPLGQLNSDSGTFKSTQQNVNTALVGNHNSAPIVHQNSVSIAQKSMTPILQQNSAPVFQQNYASIEPLNSTLSSTTNLQQIYNTAPVEQKKSAPVAQHNSATLLQCSSAPFVQQNLASQQNFNSGTNPAEQNFSTATSLQQNLAPTAYSSRSFNTNSQNYGSLSSSTALTDFNSSFGLINTSTFTSNSNEKPYYNDVNHSQSESLESYNSELLDTSTCSIMSNARKTLYGKTAIFQDMPETTQQNPVPLSSMCHSCCLQIQALQNEVACLKKAFDKIKRKNKVSWHF